MTSRAGSSWTARRTHSGGDLGGQLFTAWSKTKGNYIDFGPNDCLQPIIVMGAEKLYLVLTETYRYRPSNLIRHCFNRAPNSFSLVRLNSLTR